VTAAERVSSDTQPIATAPKSSTTSLRYFSCEIDYLPELCVPQLADSCAGLRHYSAGSAVIWSLALFAQPRTVSLPASFDVPRIVPSCALLCLAPRRT
jgi:hypothetical protein